MSDSDQYELNEGDEFIFAIDKSGSMQTNDALLEGKQVNRITRAKVKGTEYIRAGAKYDKTGPTLLAFGSDVVVYENVSEDKAEAILGKIQAQDGTTRTDLVIQKAWELHQASGSKQTVLFLLTDGEPTGIPNAQEVVKEVIRAIASKVKASGNEHSFAISFVTVGTPNESLKAFLTDLDDNLGAEIDIVDVKAIEEIGSLEQAFAGALHD